MINLQNNTKTKYDAEYVNHLPYLPKYQLEQQNRAPAAYRKAHAAPS